MIDMNRLAFQAGFGIHQLGRGPTLSILIYHRVLTAPDQMRPEEITAAEFDWHMQTLSRYFRVLPLSEAVRLLDSSGLPPRAACITFDDGYADNVTVALPILRKYGLPATVFVATGFLDGGLMWNDSIIESLRSYDGERLDLSSLGLGVYATDELTRRRASAMEIIRSCKYLPLPRRDEVVAELAVRARQLPRDLMMSTEQLRGLPEQGIEIGGHTVSHPILTQLPPAEARQQIEDGRAGLAEILGQPPTLFAYPNGRRDIDYTREHIDMVRAAGFQAAVITNRGVAGPGSDPYQLPRFTPWDRTKLRFLYRMAWNARNVIRD